MDAPEVTRRLVAILCADVKGYSRLIREDVAESISTLTAYQ